MNEAKLTRQYRAQFNTPRNCEVTITGTSQHDVQQAVQQQLNTRAKFEEVGENSVLIFSKDYMDATQPVGWITQEQIPEALSIQSLTQQHKSGQKAA